VSDEIFHHAVKLLAARDYSVFRIKEKLLKRFGQIPDDVIQRLIAKRYLNDRCYDENYVLGSKKRGARRLRNELIARGIDESLADEVVSKLDLPSLHDAMTAKMVDWNLRAPLQRGDAARLFRALARLGYEEDAIREEINQVHEQ